MGAAIDAASGFLMHRYFEDYGEDRLLIESTKGLSAEQQAEVRRRAGRCPAVERAWVRAKANGPR